jgi:hypothetical protein
MRLFAFIWFSDDRRLAVIGRVVVVILILAILFLIIIIIVRISWRQHVAALTIATVASRSQWTVIQFGAAHPMIGTYSDGKSRNVSWLSNLSPASAE